LGEFTSRADDLLIGEVMRVGSDPDRYQPFPRRMR
jgi:hypothetical protein